jgi:TDG/mug DNA glycosylase family protein
MKTEQVNLRLEEDILADVERVARAEALDRATVIRRLLRESLGRWQLNHALRGYERGELSIGRAAEEAGLTQWELMDAIRREGVAYPMSGSDVHERIRDFEAEVSAERPSEPGFQVQLQWLGSPVITLADIPPRPGGILVVGINPAPASVAAGHYYQGRLGRRLWARLGRFGLLEGPIHGAEDEALARAGHGLTDLVKRPTSSADHVGVDELSAGVEFLRDKIRAWEPGLILFPFKKAAVALLNTRDLSPGRGPEFEGVPTFLLSGPYAPTDEARRVDEAFLATQDHS